MSLESWIPRPCFDLALLYLGLSLTYPCPGQPTLPWHYPILPYSVLALPNKAISCPGPTLFCPGLSLYHPAPVFPYTTLPWPDITLFVPRYPAFTYPAPVLPYLSLLSPFLTLLCSGLALIYVKKRVANVQIPHHALPVPIVPFQEEDGQILFVLSFFRRIAIVTANIGLNSLLLTSFVSN